MAPGGERRQPCPKGIFRAAEDESDAESSSQMNGCVVNLVLVMFAVILLGGALSARSSPARKAQAGGTTQTQLRIVAGSGFSSFEPILKRWGQQNGVDVQVTYKGSLDIMLMLEDGSIDYDAIWEGDSLWTSLGDKQHLVKNSKSIMCSPIVFGVKRSVAQQLGWIGRDVGMQEILDAAESRRLRVLMTSATQSNSGASAYFGFLYAFAGQPEVLTAEHLQDPAVGERSGASWTRVDRTSESSGWLRDYFLANYDGYDAMFNYESHVLEMNQKLARAGDEPLYIVYPAEGLGMADFPFSFVQQGQRRQGAAGPEAAGLPAVRAGAAGDRGQGTPGRARCATRWTRRIFRPEWGADAKRTLNAFKYPGRERHPPGAGALPDRAFASRASRSTASTFRAACRARAGSS